MTSIYDTNGQILASFHTRKEAMDFVSTKGRYDWEIKEFTRKPTKRMIAALHFCEEIFPNIKFEGNIDSFKEVSEFLANYLEDAKQMYQEIEAEYSAYYWEKLLE